MTKKTKGGSPSVPKQKRDDPLVKLKSMPLPERIAAVAADVESRRDEYRSIEPEKLAEALEVYPSDAGSSDRWEQEYYVYPYSIDDILRSEDTEGFLRLLEPYVEAERFEQLEPKIELLNNGSYSEKDFQFLTEKERLAIINGHLDKQADDPFATSLLAYCQIEAPNKKILRFEVDIGDAGVVEDLRTPYDLRDQDPNDLRVVV